MMKLSDNLLAAVLDGHASAEETMRVLDCARRNQELQRFLALSKQVDNDLEQAPQCPAPPLRKLTAKKPTSTHKVRPPKPRK